MNKALLIILLLSVNLYTFSQATITIKTDKQTYRSGEKITVDFSTTKPLAKESWVGLFKASVAHGSTSGYLEYHYTKAKTSGIYTFTPPKETGQYELRVFDNDPNGKELKSIPIKVRAIDEREISFSIMTDDIKPIKNFDVKIENTVTVNPEAWVGIFKKDSDKKDARSYLSYKYYSTNKDNVISLIAPTESGDYELRLYAADPGALIKHIPFRVGSLDLKGLSFTLNKEKYNPEEEITIKYKGHAELTDNAWLGLFKADAQPNSYKGYFAYEYLKPKTGGTVSFKAPATKGNYQVRMFYADYGPQLLTPKAFAVTSSLDKDYLKKNIETKGKVTLYGIYFDTNKSTVKSASYTIIEQIAVMLNENSNLKIRIEGHTDADGETAYNQELSEKRAAAVKALLISKYKVSASQLESKGYGESKPIDDNNTSAGKSKNRRVSLIKI